MLHENDNIFKSMKDIDVRGYGISSMRCYDER